MRDGNDIYSITLRYGEKSIWVYHCVEDYFHVLTFPVWIELFRSNSTLLNGVVFCRAGVYLNYFASNAV